MKYIGLCCVFLFTLEGCKPSKVIEYKTYCAPPVSYRYDSINYSLPEHFSSEDSVLLRKYSYRSLMMAYILGIAPVLFEIERLEKLSPNPEINILYIRKKQQVNERVITAMNEISSISAELECEEQRAYRTADRLRAMEDSKVRKYTLLSIMVGALTAIETGILQYNNSNSHAQGVVGIAGGTITALLNIKAFFIHYKVLYEHSRNPIRKIISGSDSFQFPPWMWYMMNEKRFSTDGTSTIRDHVVQDWEPMEDKKLRELLLSNGGKYTAEQLKTRSEFLNRLNLSVSLSSQDLQLLLLELQK